MRKRRKYGGSRTCDGSRGRVVPQLQGLLELAAAYNLVAGKVIGVCRTPPNAHLGATTTSGVVRITRLPCHDTVPVKRNGNHYSSQIELKPDHLQQRRGKIQWKGSERN